ncbi:putative proteasome-type protease [Dongia mobilis]|uniref:Putative proteasome-type protease n=1 Tax=Dongia mobilis TaxID=578943 RepID=A0A4V3DEW3_9PROT|nr:proteasome-type protease [Dongia mobilis]TDQ83340.1 putative proteasome-type protease [Dongia mobilis]
MTYCVGLKLRDGLVMISDTRTNAGIDNISCFRKLHLFCDPGERCMAIASSGNLSITQSVISLLTEGLTDPESGKKRTLMDMPTMFKAAQLVGAAVREVYRTDGPSLEQHQAGFDVALLLGGQIRNRRMRLFMIYSAGNFIEATGDTPYLQIGEHKYGKPILDRAITHETDLAEALKIGLISMDSTMRSNLAVGLPLDLMVLRENACQPELVHRIHAGDPYFEDLRRSWSEALRASHQAIPQPPYKGIAGAPGLDKKTARKVTGRKPPRRKVTK